MVREQAFVAWLRGVVEGSFPGLEGPATEVHLVGDLFDFWFEYKRAIPRGGVRLLGAIAEVVDAGVPVHYHVGNHDMWSFGYLEEELGVQLHRKPMTFVYNGQRFCIGHGDGLGPGDAGYKRLKRIFKNPFLQWGFRWIHPDIGIRLAAAASKNSRATNIEKDAHFENAETEWLWQYARELQSSHPHDYFIFGHRHLPLDLPLNMETGTRYINLGDWIRHFTALRIDECGTTLDQYEIEQTQKGDFKGLKRIGPWQAQYPMR